MSVVLKSVLGIFKIALRLRDRHVNENLFQKTRVHFFSWKFHDLTRNNLYKTVQSEANVTTNRMGSTR